MIEQLIQEGEYQQALELLNDLNDEQVRYQRLVCLVGLEQYQQAKSEGQFAKANAKDTYYDVVSMYITTLKELGDYDEATDILIEELSMPYIPYQYEMIFNTAYDQILLEKQEARWEVESKNQIFSIEEIEQIFLNRECNEDLLYMAIDQLQQLNVRLILPTIKSYLSNSQKHFFSKSLIMEILIEQQIDEEIEVEKFGVIYDFNPSYMPLVLEQSQYIGIISCLESVLEDENPTLFEQCVEYLEYILYAIYPKEIYEEDYALKAAAIHYYIATLQSIDIDIEDIEILYHCQFDDVEKEILTLKQIEC